MIKIKNSKIVLVVIIALVILILIVLKSDNENLLRAKLITPRQIPISQITGETNPVYRAYKAFSQFDLENKNKLSKNMLEHLNLNISLDSNIYEYDRKSIFVLESKKNKKQNVQIQLLNGNNKFVNLSAYEISANDESYNFDKIYNEFLDKYRISKKDSFGNKVEIGFLDQDSEFIFFHKDNNTGLSYFYYNEINNEINAIVTRANEILAYKDGILYTIAYSENIELSTMLKLLNDFIK